MAGLDRLSGPDLLMLQSEEAGWPMHIGVVAVLDGGALVDGGGLVDANGRFDVEAARQAVGRRLYRVPRFLQVLHVPPRLLGPPLWVDAPAVDLARHVHVRPLMPPAGTAQFVQVVEELWSPRLDLARPPWEMWFLPGLTAGRVGVLLKLHHVVADGVGGMALLGALLDREMTQEPRPSDRPPVLPPSTSALLRDQLRRLRPSGRAVSAVAHPVALVRGMKRGWAAMRELDAVRRMPPTSLDRVVGTGRRLRVVSGRLDLVHDVAHAHGATVNDVLLAAVAGGLRALLLSRGEDVHDLRPLAYEPVTLLLRRAAAARPDEGGMIFVPLPLGVDDPVELLRQVAVAAAGCKQHVIPAPAGGPNRSRLVRRLMMRFAARQRWADVYVANVPGPRSPLYLAGAKVQELYPVVPLAGRVPVGVGALSYAGRLGITVVADRDACPDIEVFTDGLRAALAKLEHAASSAAPPPDTVTAAGRERRGDR
jgi:diacylglycerol O-acyltransferase / wax synthase